MTEKELIALFCLSQKVMKETKAYVEFCSGHGRPSATVVRIQRDGYDPTCRADAYFIMYDDETTRNISLEVYEAAIAYLAGLLKENGS